MRGSPFWWLAGGLGVAFLITSGRAEALYAVLTSPIDKAGPAVPAGPPDSQEGCIGAGGTWVEETGYCVGARGTTSASCLAAGGAWHFTAAHCEM